MTAHFEVVHGSDGITQPWHGRMIVNGRITWVTETHSRMVGVERAIESLLRELAGGHWGLSWNVEGREKVALSDTGALHHITVRYVDERTQAGEV